MTEVQVRENKRFYGVWIVVGIWLVYFLAAPPGSYASSIISTHIVGERGWSESVIGMATSIFYLSMALISIPTSILIRRKGIRFTIVVGATIGIVSYVFTAFFAVSSGIYVTAFGGIGISSSMCAIVTGSTAINTWYDRNKAVPMSILITAGGIGGFILPMLVSYLLDYGAVYCWLVFIAMDMIVIIVAVFMLKDKPEDIGEIRDGYQWTRAHPMTQVEKKISQQEEPPIRYCYRTKQFAIVSVQVFIGRAANAAVTSYVIVYAIQHGVSALQAGLLITLYNAASLVGRFSVGLLDRYIKQQYINALALGLVAAECVMLHFAGGYGSFCISVLFGGCGFGALCTLFPLLVANYFGKENFSFLNGIFNTIGTLGSFVSPMLIFAVAQALGGYHTSYMLVGIIVLLIAVIACFSPVTLIKVDKKK